MVKRKNLVFALNVDETTDDREFHVLNILLRFRDQHVLMKMFVLSEPPNATPVASKINEAIVKHELQDHVFFIITDNTAHAWKSYSDILSGLSLSNYVMALLLGTYS